MQNITIANFIIESLLHLLSVDILHNGMSLSYVIVHNYVLTRSGVTYITQSFSPINIARMRDNILPGFSTFQITQNYLHTKSHK